MKKLHFFIISIFLIFSLSCRKGSPGKNTPVVETIDGIEYIHNPAKPIYPEETVVFEEEMEYTGEDEDDIYVYSISNYSVDNMNNVYITDWQEQDITVFDEKGKYIKTIGRKGQGPGEFQHIGKIVFFNDGKFIATDGRNQRISVFSADGKFLKSHKFNKRGASVFSFTLYTDSTLTLSESIQGDNKKLFKKTFDFEGNEIVDYGEFMAGGFREIRKEKSSMSIGFPYDPNSTFAGDNKRQWLYHCMNGEYIIEVYDKNADLIRKIDRPYDPVPITEKDKEDFRSLFDKNRNEMLKDLLETLEFPEVKPVTDGMTVDENGNLWFGTYETKKENDVSYKAYDVFDNKGIYTARAWINEPENMYGMKFVNGKMYRMEYDRDSGARSIKRFKMTWTEK